MSRMKYKLFRMLGLVLIFITTSVIFTGWTHYSGESFLRTQTSGGYKPCRKLMTSQGSMAFVEELLHDNVTYDLGLLPSWSASRIYLDKNGSIHLGDVFTVTVRLYDGYNRPMYRGGDMLAIMMQNYSYGAGSVGHVVDHHNGSYTGILRALWTGSVAISVRILYPREALSTYLKHMGPYSPGKTIMCVFQNDNARSETFGYPSVEPFRGIPFCNMTSENYGLAWYCVKPNNPLVCHDWVQFTSQPNNDTQWTNKKIKDFYLMAKRARRIRDTISVIILGRPGTTMATAAETLCTSPDISETWTQPYTSGFFYRREWYSMACSVKIDEHSLRKCLSNRRLHILGDSTVRQFFSNLYERLNMTMVTEKWTVRTWHRYTESQNRDMKFTMSWAPHELPLYYNGNRASARPLYVNIDDIPSGSNDIVIIHIYVHFRFHHPSVFRESIRRAAQATRRLMRRSPRAVVGIKGTHYFRFSKDEIDAGFGLVYDAIIREEFSDMFSRVILINEWDLILASDILVLHPPAWLVKLLVDSFLGYACSL
ncbi:NXPE family member 3-like [Haliotis rufescens]|uniref:NXPE family member 3-like n=1 Tax=Haliotis rufescens TaxID=6454 RepID=UPI00201F94F5|nr:NXPE family member 3-like [Haliotis rufescens]